MRSIARANMIKARYHKLNKPGKTLSGKGKWPSAFAQHWREYC